MIERFEMERMQSTWENLVDYDMSESGVRPLTLRELVDMGFDLDAFLDQPLGYSQSNGTIELRERLTAIYPGTTVDNIEVTNGTSEANYLIALSQLRPGDEVAMEVPNYMQMPVSPAAWAPRPDVSPARGHRMGTRLGRVRARGHEQTRLLYLSNPNNPTGSILSDRAMTRICERCEATGTWILADEVYLGAEIDRPRTTSFWGRSERVIVTSGLSKAYGIPGVRIGWLVGPADLVDECWTQHDYLTIGPNKMSDRIARIAVEPANREKCYSRTRDILRHNLPIARQWVSGFGGRLTWKEPQAGAIGLVKYDAPAPSLDIADRVRTRQSTLIVPGVHVGMEGHLRLWLGGREEFLREGLRRVAEELKPLFD